ncbi:hypothetical protein KUTeg_022269 [Tegillarca granosa]|uniref:Uncharacterized protein n=1 Tax=Tegillarca granosa TaxID=220873 RepID=A0ABQ9EBB6_TEGGR|nr:hypothetical protein KUTeg_022269 [Tegillarca granosa]
MIVGGLVLMILSFIEVGGLDGLEEKYGKAIPNTTLHSNTTCGYPREDNMHFFRDPVKGDIPWPGLLGISINSVWYWCSDQVIVQRALAAKNYDHAKAGTILCGYMKILPLFLLVFPGMIARVLFPDTVGCAEPDICEQVCNSRSGCSNIAYPTLVIKLMPPGARGLMLAVMMAALMSSLTSIFNSSSTIFALDIWTRIRKKASELEVMIVGRIFVVILVIISILWVPVIRATEGSDLYVYIQEISSFMQPPICCIFLLGLFWERLNEKGAFFGMLIGMGVGLIRFIVEYSYSVPLCGEDRPDLRPAIIKNFHYLYFSPFLFFLTGICAIVISLFTKPIDKRCLQRLTWWTRHSTEPRLDIDTVSDLSSSSNNDKKEAVPLSDVATNDTTGDHDDLENKHEGDELVKKEEIDNDPNKQCKYEIDQPEEPAKLLNDQDLDPEVVIEPKHREQIIPSIASMPRRLFNWVCGIDKNKEQLASHEVVKLDQLSIIEKRPWKIISNISAVVLMIAAIFQLAFFA